MRAKILALMMLVATVVAPAVLAGPAGPLRTAGADEGTPECTPNTVLETEEVRIWFQGLKGHIKVFDMNTTDDGEEGRTKVYDYSTQAIVELDDDNGTRATMDLGHAFPHESGCTVVETEEWLNITFTVSGDVDAGTGGGGPVGEAFATFVYHFNKSANGAKFDLIVDDWPWQGDDTHLGFDFRVHSGEYTIESAENGVGFRDDTGDSKGYLTWDANATARYDDGHDETAIVDSETDMHGANKTADVRLHFTNVSAGYVQLDYDPFVGIGDYIILAGVLVPLGGVEALLPAPVRPAYGAVSGLI